MAGTTELARAVAFITGRGGSVRLIGDDQQLAAIGAGGVLRDLAETCGAVRLSQVVRFTDPAEGAASLALRAGDLTAIGFYLDHRRVHVGDAGTVTDLAYAGWAADRAAGRDALMLAPTRQIAAALNTRARTDRLAAAANANANAALDGRSASPLVGLEVRLADGSRASAGDTVITRRNDRRLAFTATDWVKNGDRWTVEAALDGGALRVVHLGTQRRLTLPAAYVAEHVALGYASTVHAAQGSTTEVCHTVGTGAESRQLLYVAMTRGRSGNHLYLASAGDGDGDEHSVITPDALLPPTAVDLLGRILRRDGAQTSASTAQRDLADLAGRLAAAADRYADSLTVAAEAVLEPARLAQLDAAAELAVAGLTTAPAYPALRAHLTWLAVDGHDPVTALTASLVRRGLDGALDPAAVLLSRLTPAGSDRAHAGLLPWLPAIPAGLVADPTWGGYLRIRDSHTRELADRVAARARTWTPTSAPAWAAPLVIADPTPGSTELLGRLAVWRAANAIDDTDLRLSGPPRLTAADSRAQQALDADVRWLLGEPAAAANRWRSLAEELEPRLLADPCWPQLADRLAAADRAGIDITALVRTAAARGPLPDELPAAALWWRLSRQLSPAALSARNSDSTSAVSTLRPRWTPALAHLIGVDATCEVLADPAWPALVAAVTDATSNGWTPQQVLATGYGLLGAGRDDQTGHALRPSELATALVWRIAMLTDPDPVHPDPSDNTSPTFPPDPADQHLAPPDDLYDDVEPPDHDVLSPPAPRPQSDRTGPDEGDWPIRSEPPADLDQQPEADREPTTHQTLPWPLTDPAGHRAVRGSVFTRRRHASAIRDSGHGKLPGGGHESCPLAAMRTAR